MARRVRLRLRGLLGLAALVVPLAAAGAPPLQAIYPGPAGARDERVGYDAELLDLALQHCGETYELRQSTLVMGQERSLLELETGSDAVTIVPVATSIERERRLLPIRIPLYKGLIGWRLPLVSRADPDLLAGVRNIEDLRRFTAGQGHDWPDSDIFEANRVPVLRVTDYDSLFRMLALGRFDYFPRSVREVWLETAAHEDDGLVLDSHIAIHYPSADYFFVNRNNSRLGEAVRRGLEATIRDGSFDRLFDGRIRPLIERAHFERRVTLEFVNPALPPETPLARKELWFDPRAPAAHLPR